MLITRRLTPRATVAIAIAVALAIAVCHPHLGDVQVYRAGGRAVFGGDLYAVRVGAYGFTYPPFAAALFAGIAWLPVPAMFAMLMAGSVAALCVVLRRSVPAPVRTWRAAAWVAPLALTQPVITTLTWGQVDLVLAALVLHDLLVSRRGVLVGLAAAVKLTPAVFVLYLLLCGRRREAGTATVTFAAAAGLGALVAPAASWRYWTHDVVAGSGVGGFDHLGNQSVRGLAERLLGAGPGTAVWLVLAGPVLAGGLLLARRAARAGEECLAAGVTGVTACLVSPVAWPHHWVWCIPCLACLPALVRVGLGVVFLSPFELRHVLGLGYAVVALIGFAIAWGRQRSGLAWPPGMWCPSVPAGGADCRHEGPAGDSAVSADSGYAMTGEDFAGYARDAEAHGVDSIWLPDLVSAPHAVDPLVGTAYAAAATTALKVGTGVIVLPGRNPVLLASQLATLAVLAPRRILPSFGLRPAVAADRNAYPVPGPRAEVFDEAMEIVRALLTRESVTYRGRHFEFVDVAVAPRPARAPDLWLGGRAPAALRRVGRLADGWLGSFVTPDEAADCRRRIADAAAQAGREIEADHYGSYVLVAGADDDVDRTLTLVARQRPELNPRELVCRGWAEAAARVQQFVAGGITKFVVTPAGPVRSRTEFLDDFATHLMPLQN